MIANSSGGQVGRIAYYPSGTVRSTTGTIPTDKLFVGGQQEGDQYKFGTRFYRSGTSTFTSPDRYPASLGVVANPYMYAALNPLRSVDPTGLAEELLGGEAPPVDPNGCWSDFCGFQQVQPDGTVAIVWYQMSMCISGCMSLDTATLDPENPDAYFQATLFDSEGNSLLPPNTTGIGKSGDAAIADAQDCIAGSLFCNATASSQAQPSPRTSGGGCSLGPLCAVGSFFQDRANILSQNVRYIADHPACAVVGISGIAVSVISAVEEAGDIMNGDIEQIIFGEAQDQSIESFYSYALDQACP